MAGYAAIANASTADAQTSGRWSVDLSVNEGYNSNPYLENGGDHGSVNATLGSRRNIF